MHCGKLLGNHMDNTWSSGDNNDLCYLTRIVYLVSKAGTQGYSLGVLRELFPKILPPKLPWDSSSFTTFKNLFNIKKREKITWSVQSIGFHSNFILSKTVNNFVLQAAAFGWYKKMQFEHLSGLLKCPEVCASSVENPGAILTFLPGIGYFFSNGFSPYCPAWVFIIEGILWPRWQTLVAIEMCNSLQVQYWIVLPSWD